MKTIRLPCARMDYSIRTADLIASKLASGRPQDIADAYTIGKAAEKPTPPNQ